MDIRQAHLVANLSYRRAFEFKARAEAFRNVAGGAAKSEHRVFFVGFVTTTTDQIRVFIRFEIGQANNNGLRREGGRNCAHSLGQLVNEELNRVGVPGHLFVHRGPGIGIELIVFKQCLWMHADHSIDDEFEPRKPDAGIRNAGEVEGTIRVAYIEHYLDGNFRQ